MENETGSSSFINLKKVQNKTSFNINDIFFNNDNKITDQYILTH